jgi:hypothetical protein
LVLFTQLGEDAMRPLLKTLTSLAAGATLFGAAVAKADTAATFAPGSLIIPEDTTFQTACGSVSRTG